MAEPVSALCMHSAACSRPPRVGAAASRSTLAALLSPCEASGTCVATAAASAPRSTRSRRFTARPTAGCGCTPTTPGNRPALRVLGCGLPSSRLPSRSGLPSTSRPPSTRRRGRRGRAHRATVARDHRSRPAGRAAHRRTGTAPAQGVCGCSISRVSFAGPVATRTLALHGADVVRLDSPALPEIPLHALDTLPGKHSALVNLGTAPGQAVLKQLLVGADVVVAGYRPGALDRFGLAPEDLAARHPGVVVVTLSAWGHAGPWTARVRQPRAGSYGIAVAEVTGNGPARCPRSCSTTPPDTCGGGTLLALQPNDATVVPGTSTCPSPARRPGCSRSPAKRRNRCPRSTPRRSCRTSPHPTNGSPSPRHQTDRRPATALPIRLLRSALPPPSGRRGRYEHLATTTTTIKSSRRALHDHPS